MFFYSKKSSCFEKNKKKDSRKELVLKRRKKSIGKDISKPKRCGLIEKHFEILDF